MARFSRPRAWFAAAALLLAMGAAPREAAAVPGVGAIYLGGGGQSFGGTPGLSKGNIRYGGMFEVGLDSVALLNGFGLGMRGEWPGGGAGSRWAAEVRYTLLNIPTTRVIIGGLLGIDGQSFLSGRLGGFVCWRAEMGLPYLTTQIGLYREAGSDSLTSAASLSVGISL